MEHAKNARSFPANETTDASVSVPTYKLDLSISRLSGIGSFLFHFRTPLAVVSVQSDLFNQSNTRTTVSITSINRISTYYWQLIFRSMQRCSAMTFIQ